VRSQLQGDILMFIRVRALAGRTRRGRAIHPVSVISLAVLVAGFAGPSQAGPCTVEIDRVQAQLDAKIDAEAGTGRSARESSRALQHQEPTPDSILKAEESLGEGSASAAMVALARARVADSARDACACEEALAKDHRALQP
jgi:hypothetical protein